MRDFISFVAVLTIAGIAIYFWQLHNKSGQQNELQSSELAPSVTSKLSDDQLRRMVMERWQDRLDSIVVNNLEWKLRAASQAALANFTIKNYQTDSIKDVEISCDFRGNSGTRIIRKTYTVYEIIKPKATLTVKNALFGSVPEQASSASCRATHFGYVKSGQPTAP